MLGHRVLVLNKSWFPIGCCTVRRAITLMFRDEDGKGSETFALDEYHNMHTWDSWQLLPPVGPAIRSPSGEFRVPEMIMVMTGRMPSFQVRCTRLNVFRRDAHACQYCGERPKRTDLTIDHVMPSSRGGLNNWTNCVTACKECNTRKGNRTPEEAKMPLAVKPIRPKFILCDPPYPKMWEPFLKHLNG